MEKTGSPEAVIQPRTPADWLFLQPAILDHLHDSIIITDLEGLITGCNQAASRMFGYTSQELIGKNIGIFCLDEDHEKLPHSLFQAVKEKGEVNAEMRNRTKSGSEICIHLTLILLRDSGGTAVGVVGLAQDITERKLANLALQQQQVVLETVLESTRDYIYVKDRQGRYLFLNSSAAKSVGKTAAEILGKDDTFIFLPEDARQIMEKDREFINAGVGQVYEETHLTGGRLRHLHTSKNLCRDSDGNIIGIVGITRDVTELKQAEAALSASELNAAGARMAHALAHEINNPLAALTNALYLMQQKDQGSSSLLHSAQESLSRITKITRQMIGLYNRKAPASRLLVHDILEETLTSMDSRLKENGIKLEKRLEHCEFSGIEMDVRQLIAVLMENAIEQSRGQIQVRLYNRTALGTRFRSGFRLVIADNGPGIRPEHLNLVFEPFFSTKAERGSGLGLWIARGIVGKYGGSIRIRTSTKKGWSGTTLVVVMRSHPVYRAA
jgi:PAS domain S-box-containing protein